MNESGRILLVDDEPKLRDSLKRMLVMDGFSVSTAGDGEGGLNVLLSEPCDVAIVDIIMPGTDGMWLIDKINEKDIDVGVVVATGYGTVELVVKAMKQGALDFIQKPVDYDLLKMVARRAVERVRLVRENREAERRIKVQNQELIEANGKLMELDRLKSVFLSKAVHELKSPLTVITCTLEMVKEELQDKEFPELLHQLEHTSTFTGNMVKTVNEMLDINLIISGEVRIDRRKDDIAKVVRDSAEGTLPLLRKSGLALEVDMPESAVDVSFSKRRIEQVMVNLIGNAVKFTPSGGMIKVSLDNRDGEVVVSVSDTGSGIPSESVDSVFDDFFQVKKGDKRGAGLGLSICKRIVEAHEGRIWVESEVDRGTTFYFSIPKKLQSKVEVRSEP